MTKRRLIILIAITLPLLALWIWRARINERRETEMALFFSYVDGPVNDYAFSVTRALPTLLKSQPSQLSEARAYAIRSSEGLKKILLGAGPGWMRERLEFVAPFHERSAALIGVLPLKKNTQADWLLKEKEVRESIVYTLEDIRYQGSKTWKFPKSRFLELNALIFSLKEAQDAALN